MPYFSAAGQRLDARGRNVQRERERGAEFGWGLFAAIEERGRLPGRIDSGTTSFGSASDLASAFRRAEAAHGEHEKRTGQRDANWPEWYAAYMVAEQAGTKLPT